MRLPLEDHAGKRRTRRTSSGSPTWANSARASCMRSTGRSPTCLLSLESLAANARDEETRKAVRAAIEGQALRHFRHRAILWAVSRANHHLVGGKHGPLHTPLDVGAEPCLSA